MKPLTKGRYRVRLAETEAERAAVMALRAACFRGDPAAPDADAFDARCQHVMVEDIADGALCCSFRLLPLADGAALGAGYSAQFYDCRALAGYPGPILEMGRFCIAPERRGDPHILRTAWAGMTALIDGEGVRFLFGCSSFFGTDPAAHFDALALLRDAHVAPAALRPAPAAPRVLHFTDLPARAPDRRQAMLTMPPLLRSFLMLGGWVSDHAVVDEDLGTLHVFTGLEIHAIPENRARAFRATV